MTSIEFLPTKIVVIHDDMDETYPLIVMLKEKYTDEGVVLFKHSQEGLDFVLNNLGRKMVVLLDKNFKDKNDISGLKVFEKIREKTSLVSVVLISANSITDFSEDELKTLINKDLFKLEKFTNDYSNIIKLIDEAVNNTYMRVDSALEQWIAIHPEEDKNKPFISTRDGKVYTLEEILKEIRLQTLYGKEVERKILMLSVDMLVRRKKQID